MSECHDSEMTCFAPRELLDAAEEAIEAGASDETLDLLIEAWWRELAGEPDARRAELPTAKHLATHLLSDCRRGRGYRQTEIPTVDDAQHRKGFYLDGDA